MLGIVHEGFGSSTVFHQATCEIKRGFVPPQVDPNTGKEILDIVYSGDCSYQYGGNASVGMVGYDNQQAPDIYIPVVDVEIRNNDRIEIKQGWKTMLNAAVEDATPIERFGWTEIMLNHATRQ